jgi:hypothetical protein
MTEIEGKGAVITGGANGIGFASATEFARCGARVVLADVDKPRLEQAVAHLRAEGLEAHAVLCDVRSLDEMVRLADESFRLLGQVDIVFSLMTSDGTGSASPVTISPGFGPASMASMESSVICWIAGRRPSTRLKVNVGEHAAKPGVLLGICGEHRSRAFVHRRQHALVPMRKSWPAVVDADARIGEQRPRRVVAGDQPRRAAVPDLDPRQGPNHGELHHLWWRSERAAGGPLHRILRDVSDRIGGATGERVGHFSLLNVDG